MKKLKLHLRNGGTIDISVSEETERAMNEDFERNLRGVWRLSDGTLVRIESVDCIEAVPKLPEYPRLSAGPWMDRG